MRAVQRLKIALALVIVAFVAAAVYISIAIAKHQNFLREVSRYNVAWTVAQAVTELQRLKETIAEYGLGQEGIDGDEVQLRLDVLHNRIGIFRDASVATVFERYPDQRSLL